MADYRLEEGLDKKVKAFSMRGTGGHAMVLKIDNDKGEIQEVSPPARRRRCLPTPRCRMLLSCSAHRPPSPW